MHDRHPARHQPRFTLRQLHIFLAIAARGTTTAAADDVALSQSATSAALNELESALGVQLFDRSGKRLILNDSGRHMLHRARAIVDDASSLETSLRGGALPLRVGASTTIGNYVLPALIASFVASYPASAPFELRIGNTQDVSALVGNFDVDIGFIEGPCHVDNVKTLPWTMDDLAIVASPLHPAAVEGRKQRLNAAALKKHRWLVREPGSGTRESVDQALLPHLVQLPMVMQMGSAEAIKLGAAAGLGLACLSRRVIADFVSLGRLEIIETRLPPLRRAFSVLVHQRRFLSPAIARFIEHCRDLDSVDPRRRGRAKTRT